MQDWCCVPRKKEDWSYQACVRGSSCCLLVGFWQDSRRSNFLLLHYILPSFPDAPAWYECICRHKGKKATPETSITCLSTTVRTGLFLKPVLTSAAQHRSLVSPPLPATLPPQPNKWMVPCGTLFCFPFIFFLYSSIISVHTFIKIKTWLNENIFLWSVFHKYLWECRWKSLNNSVKRRIHALYAQRKVVREVMISKAKNVGGR